MSNPLFVENPACLGEFLEHIVGGAATRAVNKDQDMSPSDTTKRPHVDETGKAEEMTPMTPTGGAEKYKTYWSKFKRPSPGQSVAPALEKGTSSTSLASSAAGDASVVSTPKTNEAPRAGPCSASSGDASSGPATTAADAVDVVEVGDETLQQELPDNQLGDSSLYPQSPGMPVATAEDSEGVVTPDVVAAGQGDVQAHDQKDELGAHDLNQKNNALPPPTADGLSPEFMKEMDAMFGSGNEDDGERPVFRPEAADVRACLQRKTTVDLAPQVADGHTKVLMNLAGLWQPVWVPMSADQAAAAGLKLADVALAAAEPSGQKAPESEGTSGTTNQTAAETAKDAPDQRNENGSAAPAQAEPETKDKSADEAAKAVKNGYMRFFRSVTSTSDALLLRVG